MAASQSALARTLRVQERKKGRFMTKQWFVAVLGAAAMTASAGALAQSTPSGFYVGAEVGNADFGADDDTAIKLLAGYQFHRNIAAEVAYGMLYDKGGAEANAIEVVAVGMFPVANQLSILGKIGFAQIDADPGDRDTELTWGIGAQYDFNRNVGVRAQWQRYETDPNEVDLLSVGVIYRF
jgi:OmpA-OmpF porin, OOP family